MKNSAMFTLLAFSCILTSCEIINSSKVVVSKDMLTLVTAELKSSQQVVEFETEQLSRMLEEELFERHMLAHDSVLIMIDDVLIEYVKIEESQKYFLPLRREYQVSSASVEGFRETVFESTNRIIKRLEGFLKSRERRYGLKEDQINQRLEYFSKLLEELNDDLFYSKMILGSENEYWYYSQVLVNKITRIKYELLMGCSNLIKWPCFYYSGYFPVVLNNKNTFNVGEEWELEIGVGTYFTYVDESSTVLLINGRKQKIEKGVVKYDLTTSHEGDNELEVELTYSDPLTGESQQSNSKYFYTVFNN